MSKTQRWLVLALAVIGLTSGYAAKKAAGGGAVSGAETEVARPQAAPDRERSTRASAPRSGTPAGRVSIPAAAVRSADTLDTLKALPVDELYPRLALWMIGASAEEISAWWDHYTTLQDQTNDLTDLVFINWTRLDPRAAIAAVKGTGQEHYAWWAWACHDPELAMATAIAEAPDKLGNVTWGIGEFHPEWLMENLDKIPPEGRDRALQGLEKWDDAADPLKVLTFLRENGREFHRGLFKVLVRKDPWTAYEWIEENGQTVGTHYGGSLDVMEMFVDTVIDQHPEVLEQVAARMPPGQAKRQIEATMFERLLASDPDEAERQAMEITAPKVAEARLTEVALKKAADDPDRAFEIVERMLEISPGAFEAMTYVRWDGGGSGWGGGSAESERLIGLLVAADPERMISMVSPDEGGPGATDQRGFSRVAEAWAERDVESYASWAADIEDRVTRGRAATPLIETLRSQQRFEEAADWAVTMERPYHLQNLFQAWGRVAPDTARAWLENSALPSEEVERLARQGGLHE